MPNARRQPYLPDCKIWKTCKLIKGETFNRNVEGRYIIALETLQVSLYLFLAYLVPEVDNHSILAHHSSDNHGYQPKYSYRN